MRWRGQCGPRWRCRRCLGWVYVSLWGLWRGGKCGGDWEKILVMLNGKGHACTQGQCVSQAADSTVLGIENNFSRLELTDSDMPTKPVGWYTDTFCVWKSEISPRILAAVVSFSISAWYSSNPATKNGSPKFALCKDTARQQTYAITYGRETTSP